jgi:hypothetical protein
LFSARAGRGRSAAAAHNIRRLIMRGAARE